MTIALSSSDTTEGTVSPASLTFTTANWNVAQTVTVTGVDDALVDGAVAYTIVTAATSADAELQRRRTRPTSRSPTPTTTRPGITVTPTTGLTTTEAGRHGDLYGGAEHAADGGRDDCAELERHDRRHGQPGEPDLYDARTGTWRRR